MRWLKALQKHPLLVECAAVYIAVLVARVFFGSTHMVFSQDQARDALIMEQYSQQGNWLVGYGPKASVGNFYLPPFYYQLHLIASSLTGFAPMVMQWLVIAVEAATPVVLLLLLKRFTRPNFALALATLYGLFSLPFFYATFAWNPNMIPFFSALALYAWVRLLTTRSYWWIFVGMLSVTIAVHLHYQSIVVVPFMAIVFFLDVRKNLSRIKYWLLASVVALLTVVPYLMVESQQDWQNTRQIIQYFTQEHSHYFDRISKPEFVFSFFPSFIERVMTSDNYHLIWVGRLIFFGGLLSGTVLAIKSKIARLILLYLLVIFIMLRFYKGDKLDYYLSTLFIMPTLLLGFISKWLPKASVILLLPIAFLALTKVQHAEQFNGLRGLSEVKTFIGEHVPESEMSLLFHDDDIINWFAYALRDGEQKKVMTGAKYLVEICGQKQECNWRVPRICSESRGGTYASLIRDQAGYTYVASKKLAQGYTIVIGQTNQPVHSVNYPLIDTTTFGNDLLIDGIYTQ